MKNCPKCRVETRSDAEWCWFCGYSYEDAEAGQPRPLEDAPQPADEDEAKDSCA